MTTRRESVRQLSAGAAAALMPFDNERAAAIEESLAEGIRLGHAAITWGGNDEQAIEDIAALGFPDPGAEARVVEEHVSHARFLRDARGLYLQLIDEGPKGRALAVDDYRRLGQLPGAAMPSFQFVELGRGSVDLGGVFAALRDIRFTGWGIVELVSVPEPGRTPKDAAMISKRYLQDVIGARIS